MMQDDVPVPPIPPITYERLVAECGFWAPNWRHQTAARKSWWFSPATSGACNCLSSFLNTGNGRRSAIDDRGRPPSTMN
jgi:hypothetical protein